MRTVQITFKLVKGYAFAACMLAPCLAEGAKLGGSGFLFRKARGNRKVGAQRFAYQFGASTVFGLLKALHFAHHLRRD